MIKNLANLTILVFLFIFLVWIGSLFFVNRFYQETVKEDSKQLRDYIALSYRKHQNWEFIKELWVLRPLLMKIEIKGSKEVIFSSHRENNSSFFQKLVDLDLDLNWYDEGCSQLHLVYSTLPQDEVIYYASIALAMILGFFLILFFFCSFCWYSF